MVLACVWIMLIYLIAFSIMFAMSLPSSTLNHEQSSAGRLAW